MKFVQNLFQGIKKNAIVYILCGFTVFLLNNDTDEFIN